MSSIKYTDLNKISYTDALKIQEATKLCVLEGKSKGEIFLLEHSPAVITLGRNANQNNIILPKELILKNNYEICETTRGGDVTVHEPGQLVIYFVVPIRLKGVKNFILNIMDKTIFLLQELYKINAHYLKDKPGLWVEDRKICSFGFDLRGKVSMHGLALNFNNTLQGFKLINPCGLPSAKMTSVSLETNNNENISSLKEYIINKNLYN